MNLKAQRKLNWFRWGVPHERPRLSQVILRLILFVLCVLSLRWFVLEPFIVPSGSMFPNLYVNDYILVNKWTSGIKIPLTQKWLLGPRWPDRGEIVVFRSRGQKIYFVKRLIGWPGDHIVMHGHRLYSINGMPIESHLASDQEWASFKTRFDYDGKKGFKLFKESIGSKTYFTMYTPQALTEQGDEPVYDFHVPNGEFFYMGDHRSSSSDSREWGPVPIGHFVGPVWRIFLSCETENLQQGFCDPSSIRWDRLFKRP